MLQNLYLDRLSFDAYYFWMFKANKCFEKLENDTENNIAWYICFSLQETGTILVKILQLKLFLNRQQSTDFWRVIYNNFSREK